MKPKPLRLVIVVLLIILIGVSIFARMRGMIIRDGEAYASTAQLKSTKKLTVYGMRGTIYDKNMVPVSYDRTSYDIAFYRDPSKANEFYRENYTKVIIQTIELVESLGKKTVADFWLKKDESGVWRFDTGSDSVTVEAAREKQWRANFLLNTTAEEKLWDAINQKYFIPKDLSEEMKIKVLAIWQASRMSAYTSMPVVIARDVGFECVTRVEALAMELDGMSIQTSSARVYPQGATACHAIGYISKIMSDSALEVYRSKGYPNDATVGVAGIEASMEDQLSQYLAYRQGSRVVEVDTRGKVVREISYTEPQDGNSVVLTIDVDLQDVMAKALAANIRKINADQRKIISGDSWQRSNRSILEEYAESGREIALAETGAMIAMDPSSGRILGMVSHPDFPLDMFEGGISGSEWSTIVNNEFNPLYNRAVSAKDTPGSIFKLTTALGALAEGDLTLTDRYSDKGEFKVSEDAQPVRCWTRSIGDHQNQTVVEGIKNSCNYFFYEVAVRMGSEKINKWAAALGLTSRTNVELPSESTSFVGNTATLYDPDRAISDQYTAKPIFIANALKRMLLKVGEDRGIDYDDERVDEAVKSLLDIVTQYDTKSQWNVPIRNILVYDMNIPVEYIAAHYMGNTIVTYLQDLYWTPSETLMLAIGQSITQVTPIAVARYVSAIVNGGTVYDAQIVDKIISADGKVVLDKEPVVANRIDADPAFFEAIREGMRQATSVENGGTAAKELANSKYQIAAKTGTSERTELDVENNSWLVCFAPAQDPKIVVVVYIQNGYAGVRSSAAARATIEYYLDNLGGFDTTTAESEFTLSN
jgi:penicillin-binding protein 2